MKKLYFFLTLIIISWLSCQKPQSVLHKADWTGYKKAYAMLLKNNDSAFYYFNEVASNAKDSLPVAMAYNNMSVIQSNAGDFYGAQESLTMSLKFLNESSAEDFSCLANDYNELGMNSSNLKNHSAAIDFYKKSRRFTNDPYLVNLLQNNKALAYQENKDYKSALKIYEDIISKSKVKDIDYARTLTNLNITKWLLNPTYDAAPQLLTALRIRRQAGDVWGQNSSYDHLADFYMHKHIDSALYYSREMYSTAVRLNSPDDQLLALEKLIKAGPIAEAKRYFNRYQSLNDSIQTARSAAKNQFALIRYNVEKSKADNLLLQKDNADKKYQLSIQHIITFSAFIIAFLVVTGITYWLRKKKQLEVRENQLRMSNKVHNRLANGLYQLIQEIDNGLVFDKERAVRQLNVLYERSRNISHEQPQQQEGDFAEQIGQLLTAFAGSGTNLAIVGNDVACWLNIDASTKAELEQTLQEWMVNMKKHSQATNVSVRFERLENKLNIHYTDNGIGLPEPIVYGHGLKNTENRIKSLGGTITFGNGLYKGIKIHLILPIA